MKPTLEAKIYYRGGKVGMPHKDTARLFNDRIEIVGKGGVVTKIPLTAIARIKLSNTVVGVHFIDGGYNSLDFQTLSRRILFSLFGWLGILVGSFSGPGREQAQTWTSTLQQQGVSAS